MFKRICLLFVAVILLIHKSEQNDSISHETVDNVPALFYSKTNKLSSNIEFNVGQSLNDADLESILEKLYPKSVKKVAIVLLNKLNDQNIRLNNAKNKIDMNKCVYVPSISASYDKINNYLQKNEIKIELYRIYEDDYDKSIDSFNELKYKFDSIILTGLRSIQKRSPRATSALTASNTSNVLIFGSQCAASFQSIYAHNLTGETAQVNRTNLTITDKSFTCNDNQTAVLLLKFAPGIEAEYLTSLQITYASQSRSWLMRWNDTIATTNKDKQYRVKLLSLPYNSETPLLYSYACTAAKFQLAIVNSSSSTETKPIKYFIYMNQLQIQPFGVKANQSEYKFGVVNYCDGFFTNGIWMAITASLLMGIILAFGISALVSITTMDRFDDPKGKPLAINAEK